MELDVGGGQIKAIVRSAIARKVKRSSSVGLAAITLGVDIAQGHPFTDPMDRAGDARRVELPPMKGPAGDGEGQVGVLHAVEGDDPLHMDDRRLAETIRLDGAGDLRTDGTGDGERLGGAEAVGQVNSLPRDVHGKTGCAEVLRAALEAGAGERQQVISILKDGFKGASRLAAKSEIGKSNAAAGNQAFAVVPAALDF